VKVELIIKSYLFNYYFYLSSMGLITQRKTAIRLPPFDNAAATPMRKFEV